MSQKLRRLRGSAYGMGGWAGLEPRIGVSRQTSPQWLRFSPVFLALAERLTRNGFV